MLRRFSKLPLGLSFFLEVKIGTTVECFNDPLYTHLPVKIVNSVVFPDAFGLFEK